MTIIMEINFKSLSCAIFKVVAVYGIGRKLHYNGTPPCKRITKFIAVMSVLTVDVGVVGYWRRWRCDRGALRHRNRCSSVG
jgi:hypothetical protein